MHEGAAPRPRLVSVASSLPFSLTSAVLLRTCTVFPSDAGSDYDGWPEDEGEYPVDHVTEEHREVMAEMCSKAQKPNMPVVPCVPPPPEAAAASLHVTAGGDAAAAASAPAGLGMNITPLPGQDAPLDGTMNDIAVAPFAHKKKKKSSKQQKGTVTPLPPSGAAGKKPAACKPPAAEGGESKPAAKPAPAKKEAPKPVSKKNLEMVSLEGRASRFPRLRHRAQSHT